MMAADIAWDDIASISMLIMEPKTGGLVKGSDGVISAFVGTDPDAQVNVFHYDETASEYIITQAVYNVVLENPFWFRSVSL
jgi:hypothetical protein